MAENKTEVRGKSTLTPLLGTRTFKFRAWDDKNKKWLLGYELENLGGFSLTGESILMGEWGNIFWSFISDDDKDFDDLKIMQYTGRKDKNGKEIFEGDILKFVYPDEVEETGFGCVYNQVVFSEGSFCWKGETGNLYLLHDHNLSESEVAGNIFENPELLDECT